MAQAFPVPSLATQIEADWSAELATHFGKHVDDVLQRVRPWFNFPSGRLRVELMDGSAVEFNGAFHIVSEERRAIAVFTEHSGHHLYPYHEARVFRDAELIYRQQG